mmetsp:Transcript_33715/g.94725  ORF Transcript_33715/g.94725 Transcript_33715/m.94725 type:complete len:295 (-) Transcript_33715:234-1118(-)
MPAASMPSFNFRSAISATPTIVFLSCCAACKLPWCASSFWASNTCMAPVRAWPSPAAAALAARASDSVAPMASRSCWFSPLSCLARFFHISALTTSFFIQLFVASSCDCMVSPALRSLAWRSLCCRESLVSSSWCSRSVSCDTDACSCWLLLLRLSISWCAFAPASEATWKSLICVWAVMLATLAAVAASLFASSACFCFAASFSLVRPLSDISRASLSPCSLLVLSFHCCTLFSNSWAFLLEFMASVEILRTCSCRRFFSVSYLSTICCTLVLEIFSSSCCLSWTIFATAFWS